MSSVENQTPQEDSWLRLFRELYDPRSAAQVRDEEERFGRKLVALGLVTEEQLQEGLELRERLSPPEGPPARLARVLIERGSLSKDRLARTLVERVASDPAHRLGPFVLFEAAGRLGAAEMWRAWDGRRRGWVRLACLDPRHPEAGRFLRGAGVLLRLDHPHLVPALDGGEADDRLYVAFEWIKAETLAGAPPRALAAAVRDAARGLQAALDAGFAPAPLDPSHIFRVEGGAKALLTGGASGPAAVESLRELLGELARELPATPTPADLAAALDRLLTAGTLL
jgi:hypothetical protein